jgi:hypothetical protein
VTTRRGWDRLVTLIALAALFSALLGVSWFRWGHARTDCGGALDRAARVAAGAMLYRDVESPYGPLPDLAVAAAFRLFGIHLDVAYGIGIALLLLQSALLWSIARRFLGLAEAAVGLAGFWILLAFNPGLFNWLLPNTFASTFAATLTTAALAVAIAAVERPKASTFAAASLCVAGAGLSKVEFGGAALVVVLAAVALAPTDRLRRRTMLVAALLPGFVASALVAGIFLALVPWRILLFDNVLRLRTFRAMAPGLAAAVPDPWRTLRGGLLRFVIELPVRATLAAAGLSLAARGGGWRPAGLMLAGAMALLPLLPGYMRPIDLTLFSGLRGFAWSPLVWAVVFGVALRAVRRGTDPAAPALVLVALLGVALSARWSGRLLWTSYYGFLAPFLVLLVARRLAAFVVPRQAAAAAALVFAVPLALAAIERGRHYRTHYRFPLSYPRGTIFTQAHAAVPMRATIDYVRSHSAPGDTVAVLPEERLVNFLAERRHPTRDPGLGPGWLANVQDEERFIRELEAARPRLVVVSTREYPEFGMGGLAAYNRLVATHITDTWRLAWQSPPGAVRFSVYDRPGGPGAPP